MNTSAKTAVRRRRGRPRAARLERRGHPYTMRLGDGRTVFVEVPGRFTIEDRDGRIAFTAEGVRFLDHVRALAMRLDRPPSPGWISSLREALGMTQEEMGRRIDVDKLTVSRWERGALRPGRDSVQALEKLRREASRRGVVLPG